MDAVDDAEPCRERFQLGPQSNMIRSRDDEIELRKCVGMTRKSFDQEISALFFMNSAQKKNEFAALGRRHLFKENRALFLRISWYVLRSIADYELTGDEW